MRAGQPRAGNTLPAYLTSLVDREADLRQARALLQDPGVRLVTLTGPGGVGKTRLAVRVAEEVGTAYPDGVWFVPLAGVDAAGQVLSVVALVLGLREMGATPLAEQLRDMLCDRRALLVLDNFEHVSDAAGDVGTLLQQCPGITVLATSRTRLRLSGEHELPVLPLPVEQLGTTDLSNPERLAREPAVALFLDRARSVAPDVSLSPENAAAIAGICRRLDGLPLALELAAARLKLFSPMALCEQLARPLDLLTHGSRDLPPRHQTLRDTIAWSYHLLAPEVQALFRQLAIFAGGWTLEAAAAVCQTDTSLLDGLTELTDHGLVLRDTRATDTPRFYMLETIRAFGQEQLAAHRERASAAERHAHFVLYLARGSAVATPEPDYQCRLDRLERGRDNVRAALAFAIDEAPDQHLGLRLATALYGFWYVRGPISEGAAWLDRALHCRPQADPALRAAALYQSGELARVRGDLRRAERRAEEALDVAREHQLAHQAAQAVFLLGNVAASRADHVAAIAHFNDALRRYRELGEPDRIAMALTNLGQSLRYHGDPGGARPLLAEAHALWVDLGSDWGRAVTLGVMGEVARDSSTIGEAERWFRESLTLFRDLDDRWGIADALDGLADVALAARNLRRAAWLLATADALYLALGIVPSADEQARRDRRRRQVAEALKGDMPESIDLADLPATISEALDGEADAAEAPRHGLTERELEILRLIAAGRSNKAIAAQLSLSVRTVERHITNLYAKIDAHGKADATAWAIRHGVT